jgi:hypothetical protein
VGALISFLVMLPAAAWFYTVPVKPYTNVIMKDLIVSKDTVSLVASFEKNDACDYVDLGVFGGNLGLWSRLEWQDIDDLQGDRLAGGQTLRIKIDLDQPYQEIEVRTRHDCGGEKVDQVFINIEID